LSDGSTGMFEQSAPDRPCKLTIDARGGRRAQPEIHQRGRNRNYQNDEDESHWSVHPVRQHSGAFCDLTGCAALTMSSNDGMVKVYLTHHYSELCPDMARTESLRYCASGFPKPIRILENLYFQ
jgi:hypothetical protein